MIKVFDKDRRAVAILENAYNVGVSREVNQVWTASFTLPKDDSKHELCNHLNYIEIISPSGRNYGLYRILAAKTRIALDTNEITYSCEHVLSTLIDDVMDGYFQYSNLTTKEVILEILKLQTVKHWQLGTIDFTRYFHYSFENENGLLAPIFSVPQPFDESYEFTFDTTVYPWKLNLVRASNEVKAEIRWGKDMIAFDEVSDPTNIVNYLIPKGAGEGVNQLTIEKVNGGKRYIKDDASIAEWGRQSYIWIDRRFEDAQSLLDSARAKMQELKQPRISFTTSAVDLSIKPEYAQGKRTLNGVTNIFVEDKTYQARIISEKINDVMEAEFDVIYGINNDISNLGTSTADVARRQEINEAYSQGSTNIMTFGYQDNADSSIPATIPFYIDDDVVNVNTSELSFRTKRFRGYSRATAGGGSIVKSTGGGGGTVKSTSSGGGSTATSSSGGGTSTSTNSGGGSSATSSAGGAHNHVVLSRLANQGSAPSAGSWYSDGGGQQFYIYGSPSPYLTSYGISQSHSHSVSIPSHSHSFSTPNHTHNVTIPNHTHQIDIPNHTHEIDIPNHTHDVEHEIIELNTLPTRVTIKVDGNTVPHTAINGDRINLVDYMSKDSSGKVTRGRHEVTIQPNGLGRIEADLILRVFIRSQLGGAY